MYSDYGDKVNNYTVRENFICNFFQAGTNLALFHGYKRTKIAFFAQWGVAGLKQSI